MVEVRREPVVGVSKTRRMVGAKIAERVSKARRKVPTENPRTPTALHTP